MNISKYFYDRALKKLSVNLSLLLEDNSGSDLCNFAVEFYLRRCRSTFNDKTFGDVLLEMEKTYHVISKYFGHHNYELTPVFREFVFSDGFSGEWLCVGKNIRTAYSKEYEVPSFNKKFGINLYHGYTAGLYESEWYNFIRCCYIREYNVDYKIVEYLSVKDNMGIEYKLDTTLPEFELSLLKSGYELLRDEGSELIYVRLH